MLTLVIVEDQARFRKALETVIELTPDLRLGGAFASIEGLRAELRDHPDHIGRWDVVLMDYELPGESGVAGVRLLQALRPDLPVVICTVFDDAGSVQEAIRAGAAGYLVKNAPLPKLLRRVREAASGGAPLSPGVARGLLDHLRAMPGDGASGARPLTIYSDGSALVLPGGEEVDLRRRQAVRRLLAALARARIDRPGEPVSVEDCVEAGWPDERMRWESAQARLWTSIRGLRALGLEDHLVTTGSGYWLSLDVQVRPR